jgi:uncharacterized protein YhfF
MYHTNNEYQYHPFKEVTDEFAAKEEEGDKTLSFWQKVHRKFFSLELKEYSKKFSEDMLVVCEEFFRFGLH